jgi:hypothetical protein
LPVLVSSPVETQAAKPIALPALEKVPVEIEEPIERQEEEAIEELIAEPLPAPQQEMPDFELD